MNSRGDLYESCLYGVFFFVYDYPFINAILRVLIERTYDEQVFMEGGNSCVNSFVVGSIIGAKKGVNHVVLSAPVYCEFLLLSQLLAQNLLHRDYLDQFINKLLDAMHLSIVCSTHNPLPKIVMNFCIIGVPFRYLNQRLNLFFVQIFTYQIQK